jgi:hypothetical protein
VTRPSLAAVQRWFSAVTTHPAGVERGARDVESVFGAGRSGIGEIERLIAPGPQLSALERLEIYGSGYVARLIECLRDDYPALAYLLGEDAFDALARDYIQQHPSASPSLNVFGRHMAGFCRERCGAFASELARLEWSLVEVLHAASPPDISEALRALQPEEFVNARFAASPALRVHVFAFPVNAFFQAFCDEAEAALPAPEASAVAVYRAGLALVRRDLTPSLASLLADLAAGTPLGVALSALESESGSSSGESPAELQQRVMQAFQSWVQDGFFASVTVPPAISAVPEPRVT